MSEKWGGQDWRREPAAPDPKKDGLERALSGLERALKTWDYFQIAVWTIFLVVFPPVLLARGLLFAALITSAMGLFLTYYVFWKPGGLIPVRHRRKVCSPLFALHLGIAAFSVVQLSRPLSGGFVYVDQSEKWARINTITRAGERVFVFLGSGEESKALVLEANGEGDLIDHLDYPGRFGWILLFDAAHNDLIVAESHSASLWTYSLSEKKWNHLLRPEGLTQQAAILNGRLFMVIENRLFMSDAAKTRFEEIPEVGRCFAVAASPDPANPVVLATGSRVFESPDAGKTWRDISPAPSKLVHAEAAIGGGGYLYVFEGGMFGSKFYVGEPGRPLEERRLPDSDTRIMVANPRDGREVWAGSWGGGIHRSRDAGRTFEFVGLERVEVGTMLVDFDAHKIFVPSWNMAFNQGFFWRTFEP